MASENTWRALREDAEKTQFQVAVEAGCTTGAVQAWEQGRSCPKIKNAAKLAKVFNKTEKQIIELIVQHSRASGEPAASK